LFCHRLYVVIYLRVYLYSIRLNNLFVSHSEYQNEIKHIEKWNNTKYLLSHIWFWFWRYL